MVKADGEAAGKGVIVTSDADVAKKAVKDIMDEKIFGNSGDNIIIEEFLDGQEETIYLSEFHASKGHMDQLAELDNRFHDILYESCDSKMLENLLKDYHQYVLRIRRKTLSSSRGAISTSEHKGIMDAIREGDKAQAEFLANQHIITAYENMVANGLYNLYGSPE